MVWGVQVAVQEGGFGWVNRFVVKVVVGIVVLVKVYDGPQSSRGKRRSNPTGQSPSKQSREQEQAARGGLSLAAAVRETRPTSAAQHSRPKQAYQQQQAMSPSMPPASSPRSSPAGIRHGRSKPVSARAMIERGPAAATGMTCATHHRLLRAPQTQRVMKSAQRAVPRLQRRAFRRGPTSHPTPRGICDSVRAPRWPWLLDLGRWLGRGGSEGRDCAEGLHGVGHRRSGSGRQSSSWMRAGRESREAGSGDVDGRQGRVVSVILESVR